MVKVLFICTSEVLPDWFSIRPPSTGSGSLLPSWRIRWTRSPDSASASIRPISTITTIQVGSFWWMPSPATWFNQCRRNLFNHAAAIQIWPLAVTCRVTWSFSAHSPSSDSTWTYQPASIGLILMEDRFWLLLARHRRHRRSSHHKFVISLLAALMALSSSWQSDPVYKKKCWPVDRLTGVGYTLEADVNYQPYPRLRFIEEDNKDSSRSVISYTETHWNKRPTQCRHFKLNVVVIHADLSSSHWHIQSCKSSETGSD